MSFTAIIAALGGLSAVIGGIVYIVKYVTWAAVKTPEQASEDIASDVQKQQTDFEKSGIPE